jgi:hypothetical protein
MCTVKHGPLKETEAVNWNANNFRSIKLELIHFLSDHDIDIGLINQTT